MEYVVNAAGGNATSIQVIDQPRERAWYEKEGVQLMERTAEFDPEQSGFLDLGSRHFEMSGGEFCGNAARSAAMLIAMNTDQSEFDFTMSGYEGPVHARVELKGAAEADVSCVFDNLDAESRQVRLHSGEEVQVVDLGGIVHVLIEGALPTDYENTHREVMKELELTERAAVGVNWIERDGDQVTLHPVVWVRSIDTFFYETACGSGSIAASVVTGQSDIIQPSGQTIEVNIKDEGIRLFSTMEVIHHVV